MSERESLKPCPFCGGEASLYFNPDQAPDGEWRVSCYACDVALTQWDTPNGAITAWNTRARPEPSEAVVEAVARAICKPVYRTMHPLLHQDVIDEYAERNWRNHIDQARAAIAAYETDRLK